MMMAVCTVISLPMDVLRAEQVTVIPTWLKCQQVIHLTVMNVVRCSMLLMVGILLGSMLKLWSLGVLPGI